MKELAEFLKNQRIDSNLTIEAISRLSGISVSMLDSFESFDFKRFGAPLLLRNTVRAYCDALHIDADALIQKYFSQIEACSIQVEGIRRYGRLQKTIYKRRRMVALPVIVFFLAAATVYYGGVWISKRRSELLAPPNANKIFSQQNLPVELQELKKSPAKPRSVRPAPEPVRADHATESDAGKTVAKPEVAAGAGATTPPRVSQKATSSGDNGALAQFAFGDPADAVSGGEAFPNAEAHTLNRFTVKADHKVWVQVKIDGQKTRSMMLHPGDRKEWIAPKGLQVVIGNAGGVHMEWNGQPLEAPRVAGRVLRFRLPDYAKAEQG